MKRRILLAIAVIACLAMIGCASATFTWVSASGCWTATDGTFNFTMFNTTGSSTFTIPSGANNFTYLAVAGGGGGGSATATSIGGAGGGGGGVIEQSGIVLLAGSQYNIQVGAGGFATGGRGSNGGISGIWNSSWWVNATGGGGGGGWPAGNTTGGNGGSGGGSANGNTSGTGTTGQGMAGGVGYNTGSARGGGGGGNSTAGADGVTSGNGGNGYTSTITGSSIIYGGGGGGGVTTTVGVGTGGTGGGGNGGLNSGGDGYPGTNGLGGGGGGASTTSGNHFGGVGGSGVVILKYKTPPTALTPVASYNANVTTFNSYPFPVQFTDNSTNFPTGWNWSFGDTYTSTSQNPLHIYTVANNYTVTFNATNANGNSTTYTGYINLTSDLPNVLSWMHFNTSATQDLIGNAWLTSGSATFSNAQYKFGGGALSLPSNNAYIYTPSSTTWNFGNGNFTIEFWLYPVTPGAAGNIMARTSAQGSNTGQGWGIYNNGTTGYSFWMGALANQTNSVNVANSVWSHLVVERQLGTVSIYVNGVLQTSKSMAGSFDTANPIYIGRNGGGTTETLYMDEMRISNVNRFTSTFSPPYAQYNGDLYPMYPNININATLLYKSYPSTTNAIVYNLTPRHRTIQMQNVTNVTSVTFSVDFDPLHENSLGAVQNYTNYNLPITYDSIDNTDGIETITVTNNSGFSALFMNRTNLCDVLMNYYNYTTDRNFTQYFSNASVVDGQHGVSYPITNFYNTPVTYGAWTIYTNFSASSTVANTGTLITFTSTSLGEPSGFTNYLWNFGDGSTDTSFTPIHAYTNNGIFDVTLTSTLAANSSVTNTTTRPAYINITPALVSPPVASFYGVPTTIANGSVVTFTDTSTNLPSSWSWDFGDGGHSTLQSPSHIYPTNGVYTVNLTATNTYGSNTLSKANYITVQNSVTGFNQQDLIMAPAFTLTINFVDSTTNLPIPVVRVTDSLGGNYTTTTGTFTGSYEYGAVVLYCYSDGYVSQAVSYIVDSDRTETIQLVKSTTSVSTTWYTPKTVSFSVVDVYGNKLSGAIVNASYNSTTLPKGVSDLINNYGMNSQSANDALNGTLIMSGPTDSDGVVVFTMLSTVNYDIKVTYNGDTNLYQKYPQDSQYQLKFITTVVSDNIYADLYANGNTRVWANEPDVANVTFWWSFQDMSGLTTAIDYFLQDVDLNTTVYTTHVSSPIAGGIYQLNYTVLNVRGKNYIAYVNYTRNI